MPNMFAPTDNPVLFAILIGLNVPIFMIMGRRVFGNSAAWKASLLDAFRVDHIVPFRGFKDHPWPGGKFWLFFVGCFFLVVVEYAMPSTFIARFFAGGAD